MNDTIKTMLSMLISPTAVVIAAMIPVWIKSFQRRRHTTTAEVEYSTRFRQLEEGYQPINQVFVLKSIEWAKPKKKKALYETCMSVSPLNNDEIEKISSVIETKNIFIPDNVRDAWKKYCTTLAPDDLAVFYEIFTANLNWAKQCVNLPSDEAKINPDHLPPKPSTYSGHFIAYVYYMVLAVLLGILSISFGYLHLWFSCIVLCIGAFVCFAFSIHNKALYEKKNKIDKL